MTFVEHLSRYAPAEWVSAIETLAPGIHPIDRDATRIWFAFYPHGPEPATASTSHTFLYGHHHWPQIKRAILAATRESSWPGALTDVIARIADHATRTTQVDRDQLLGVGAAALWTLRSVGLDVFTAASAAVQVPRWSHVQSIRQVRRARRHRAFRLGGMLGRRRYHVRYSELQKGDVCEVAPGATIASGLPSAVQRCLGTCTGACVIGIVAGADRVSPMTAEELSVLSGAGQAVPTSSEGAPLVRLACHARPTGDITIVARPSPIS